MGPSSVVPSETSVVETTNKSGLGSEAVTNVEPSPGRMPIEDPSPIPSGGHVPHKNPHYGTPFRLLNQPEHGSGSRISTQSIWRYSVSRIFAALFRARPDSGCVHVELIEADNRGYFRYADRMLIRVDLASVAGYKGLERGSPEKILLSKLHVVWHSNSG